MMKKTKFARTCWLVALASLSLAACGPKQVKGEAPFVNVSAWSIDGTSLTADLHIRNVNDHSLPIEGLKINVQLDAVELIDYQGPQSTEVPANGFETIKLELTASEEGTQALYELQSGKLKSLPYTMDGEVITSGGKSMAFHRKGHIYTVPGKPGQFR